MPRKAPNPPSPEILARIERELTPQLLDKVRAWADHVCARLLAVECRDDPGYAKGMVLDAIGDTYAGIRTWHPERLSLRYHLSRVINSRVSHDVARARLRRHLPFHDLNGSQDENRAEVEMSLRCDDQRARPDGRLAILETRARVFAALRAMARVDRDVGLLIGAYADGHVRRDEAMARLGWTKEVHVNVRRRLDTLVARLSVDLRSAALDILARDGGAPALTVVRRGGRIVPMAADGTLVDHDEDPDVADEMSRSQDVGAESGDEG